MNSAVMVFSSIMAYLLAAASQGLFLVTNVRPCRQGLRVFGLVAIVLHAYVLYLSIDTALGQNLTVVNILSLVTWLVGLLLLGTSFFRPVDNLLLLIFILACMLLGVSVYFPGQNLVKTAMDSYRLSHILVSILAFSVLAMAGLQACVLASQDFCLRHNHMNKLVRFLPPLETMELLLFEFIVVGFVLLSLVLLTSIVFFQNEFTPVLVRKTTLAIIAWLLFATLLFGRYCRGWRGKYIIIYTLAGVGVVLVCSVLLALA